MPQKSVIAIIAAAAIGRRIVSMVLPVDTRKNKQANTITSSVPLKTAMNSNRCKRPAHAYRMQIPSASVTSSYCTSTLIGDQEPRTHQRRVKTTFKSTLFLDDLSSTRLVGHPQRGSRQGFGHSPRYPQAIQRLCHLTHDVQAWPRPRCGKFWQGVYRVCWGQRGYRGGGRDGGGARDVVRLVLYKILKHIRRVFQLHYSF